MIESSEDVIVCDNIVPQISLSLSNEFALSEKANKKLRILLVNDEPFILYACKM